MKNFDKLLYKLNGDSKLLDWKKISRYSIYISNANTTMYWLPSDTEELFKKNLKTNKDILQPYVDNPITYDINKYGFRTNDTFNKKEYGNIFLGCSHTFGTGHHLKNTWSYKLNEYVGGKFYNLSQPGHGVETDYRMIYSYKDSLKIKNVFHFLGFYHRYEIFEDNIFKGISLSNEFDIKKYKCLVETYSSYEKLLISQLAHTNAIQNICNELNVNYHLITYYEIFNDELFNINDSSKNVARDLMHFSIDIHDNIYKSFKDLYNSNIKII